MVPLAAEMGDSGFATLACCSYHFLLRVQSEAVGLEVGAEGDAQRKLPEGRHSAVWVQNECLYISLRRRKHRPAGSLLIRACSCDKAKQGCVQCTAWVWRIPSKAASCSQD